MNCAWEDLLGILPPQIRGEVDKRGQETLQELRLRLDQHPQMICSNGSFSLHGCVRGEDLRYVINMSSRYSPWSAETVSKGYITASGGHRIGLCGAGVVSDGQVRGIRDVTSINIRVARDFPGIGGKIAGRENILILGPPGSGKTTLLRDVARQLARQEQVSVVDERGELFPHGFSRGENMDVLTFCSKSHGIDMVLRTMGPNWIAVDEITSEEDCRGLIRTGWCGVGLVATAHAADRQDLLCRKVYRPLVDTGLFSRLMILDRDKTWRWERMVT